MVTANKGPIAHAYHELSALAAEHGVALRFESTVMDGTPIFSMAEAALPATEIASFRGLLNSTSNYVLSRMAQGETLEEAVDGCAATWHRRSRSQQRSRGLGRLGQGDGAGERPDGCRICGHRMCVASDWAPRRCNVPTTHLLPGQTLKQVTEAERSADGVVAWVWLIALPPTDPLAHLSGMEAGLQLRTDTMGDLTLIEGKGGPGQTAFGVLADLIAVARRSITPLDLIFRMRSNDMRVPYEWLKEYVEVDLPPEELAERLTMAGLEVDRVEYPWPGIVTAEIVWLERIKGSDHLSATRVTTGTEEFSVVCGASNIHVHDKVPLARLGASVGELVIQEKKAMGVLSQGMLCSPRELGISDDHAGILILPPDTPLGVPFGKVRAPERAVIDLDIKAHRGDLFCVLGVAREVAAFTHKKLREPKIHSRRRGSRPAP